MVQKTQSGEEEFQAAQQFSDIELYYSAAEKGHADAQLFLGYAYTHGLGVDVDSDEADKWFEYAINQYQIKAEQGDADSLYQLGNCYNEGTGVERDKKTAKKLYEEAAKKGHAKAQYNLGCLLAEGFFSNYGEAVKWWIKAAMQGEVESQHNVGLAYELGKGVEESKTKACAWYSIAQVFSMFMHINASKGRNEIYKTLTKKEILKFEKETTSIFNKMSKNKKTKDLIEKMGKNMQDTLSTL